MNFLKALTDKFKGKPKTKAVAKKEPELLEEDKFLKYGTKDILSRKEQGSWSRKLEPHQQDKLVDLISQGLTTSQIAKRMYDEEEVRLSYQTVTYYRDSDKWKPKIRELKAKHRENFHELDGAHKSTRVRRMEYVMDEATKKHDYRAIIQANEQIRKEFEKEGDTTNVYINNPTYNELNILSTDELIKKRDEATKKLLNLKNEEA